MSDARRFTDRYGFTWQVCELWSAADRGNVRQAADGPPLGNDGWLYFFSRGTTLVLRDYPAAWEDLGPMDLERLLESARVLGSDTTIRLSRPAVAASASRDDFATARA
jgi:hypothetical protein